MEIKELEEKYLVIKRGDLKHIGLNGLDSLKRISEIIAVRRRKEGKQPYNSYVVLNQDDKINLPYLLKNIPEDVECDDLGNMQVKDLSVVLVNAILEAAETIQSKKTERR